MITRLHLTNFKNFRDADLQLGPLTVVVGTNASGKSNLRDAFRFLHGIGRGYSIAEIIGAKYGEGGELQWRGIRGGTREITYPQRDTFALEITITLEEGARTVSYRYHIAIDPGINGKPAQVIAESLYRADNIVFDTHPDHMPLFVSDPSHIKIATSSSLRLDFDRRQPMLSQIIERIKNKFDPSNLRPAVQQVLATLNSIRFLDLNPEVMREATFPGQNVLGDRGENLSSVLQAIYEDERSKRALISWLQELTPMDVVDFEFTADQIGRILVTLVEKNGQKTSAYSASDGTLRFLAMIAALLGPEVARLYFFEELENGLHPTRLSLLLQLIEQQAAKGNTQVIATTHSPALLRLLSPQSLEYASVIYRAEHEPDARIERLFDIPEAKRVLEKQDLGRLYESGWLEDAIALQDNREDGE